MAEPVSSCDRHQYIISVVESVAAKLSLNNIKIQFEDGTVKGGFLGEIHRLTVVGESGNEEINLSLIAKLLTVNKSKRNNIPIEKMCAVETQIYKEVFPKLEKLQNDARIERKFKVPKCYSVSNENYKEIIVMDDLSKSGYEMSRIGKSLDYAHSKLLLTEAARYHALCMVYRIKESKDFNKLTQSIQKMSKNLEASYNIMPIINGGIKYASDNVCCDEFQEVLEKYLKFNVEDKFKYQTDGENYNHSVILHGDLWANNCLFKYKDNKPEDITLLDWQGCRYASPVIDLLFALFIAVDEKVRQKNFQDLVNIYYKALCDQLHGFGENPAEVYPEQEFRDDIKKFSYTGMTFALFMLPIFASDHEEIEEKMIGEISVNDGLSLTSSVPSPLYISRMKQMAADIKAHSLDEYW